MGMIVDGVPSQPLPPTLEQNKEAIEQFQRKCNLVSQQLLEAFSVALGVRLLSRPLPCLRPP